jgi:outer membrane protein assembly factor BamB
MGVHGAILGIDTASGHERWRQKTTSPDGFFVSQVATDGETFYLGGWDNTLYALDARTGTPKWTATLGLRDGQPDFRLSPALAAPALGNERIFVASLDGVLHALDTRTGKEAWSLRASQAGDTFGASSPVVSGLDVLIGASGEEGNVYCVDTATGQVRWRAATGQSIEGSAPRLAPDGKSLAIMSVRGLVTVLDTATGQRLWQYDLGPGNIFSTPEYDGRIVYTTTMADDVQAINGPNVAPSPSGPKRAVHPTGGKH